MSTPYRALQHCAFHQCFSPIPPKSSTTGFWDDPVLDHHQSIQRWIHPPAHTLWVGLAPLLCNEFPALCKSAQRKSAQSGAQPNPALEKFAPCRFAVWFAPKTPIGKSKRRCGKRLGKRQTPGYQRGGYQSGYHPNRASKKVRTAKVRSEVRTQKAVSKKQLAARLAPKTGCWKS